MNRRFVARCKAYPGFLWCAVFVAIAGCTGNAEEGDGNGGAGGTGGATVTTAGGAVSAGGTTNAAGTSTAAGGTTLTPKFDPAMTAGCPLWPMEKIVPWVGLFFYGPDPGPCSETSTRGSSASVFTYDSSGRVTIRTEGSVQYEYVYDGARIQTVVTDGAVYGRYEYTSSSVTYVSATTGTNGYTAVWEVDDRGYPRRLTVDRHSTPAKPDETHLYQYENCRLVRRIADPSTTTTPTDDEWIYTYDAEGHLVRMDISDGTAYIDDYSCW